jgi:hypothetical protein
MWQDTVETNTQRLLRQLFAERKITTWRRSKIFFGFLVWEQAIINYPLQLGL